MMSSSTTKDQAAPAQPGAGGLADASPLATHGEGKSQGLHGTTMSTGLAARARPRRVSPSSLGRYQRCPKQFFLQDVAGETRHERPSPRLAQGNAVHEALALFFGLAPAQRHPALLAKALRASWPRHRAIDTFCSRDEEAEWGTRALAMLARFAEEHDLSAIPLAREQWVSTRLANGVEIFGRVDRIDPSPSGKTIEIVDYKTGKQRLSNEALRSDTAAQLYAVAASAEYGRRVSRVRLLHLGEEAGELEWRPTVAQLRAARRSLIEHTNQLQGEVRYTATPGPHCGWCPFALHCAEKDRVEASDLEPREEVPF